MNYRHLHSALFLLFVLPCLSALAAEVEIPKALDERLTVELFAAEPDIKTVTSLDVDDQGRVLAIESHTHFRPEEYDGPETDRIRLLEDTTGDGRADRIETFFTGTTHTMSLAVHPNGWVYVATRNSIFRIRDQDGDGKAEEHQPLVTLETDGTYPHNGLSGFAFDFAGNVFIGFGENLGVDATLVGIDGTRIVANLGSGGIFRCTAEGKNLERVADGFWNPFDLCFDTYGRLFVGENDPGNRPPCRFLSVVEGGDYGYRRYALEPFIAVDGEVPGTLPMTSSTGESPTGILAYESDHLPAEYRGDLLVVTWAEHRVDSYRPRRDGAGFKTTTRAIVAGGEDFRPAGIAVAPDGSLFVGDWADRSYPLHSKGRIWHIRAKQPKSNQSGQSTEATLRSPDRRKREAAARRLIAQGETGIATLQKALLNDNDPRVRSLAMTALIFADAMTKRLADRALADPIEAVREQAARTLPKQWLDLAEIASNEKAPAVQAAALRRIDSPVAEKLLLEKLASGDVLMQQASRRGLGRSVSQQRLVELAAHPQAAVRLAAVLLLRDQSMENPDPIITAALADSNAEVRFVATYWIARDELKQFHQPLVEGLSAGATTSQLFEAYLAALASLDGVMQHWSHASTGDWWAEKADSGQYVARLLNDSRTPPAVMRQVLQFLPASHPALTVKRLQEFLLSEDKQLRIGAVRLLNATDSNEAKALVTKLARNRSLSPDLRAEAVLGLDSDDAEERSVLWELASDSERAVSHEALRALLAIAFNADEQQILLELARRDQPTADLVDRVLTKKPAKLPNVKDTEAWLALLAGPADSQAGQRVFFHPKGPGCYRCHRIDGRGHTVGPNFVRMGGRLAMSRERLAEAILQPSKDIGPGYLPLTIVTDDGRATTGIFYRHGAGMQQIFNSEGTLLTFKLDEIEEIQSSNVSIMPDGLHQSMTLQEFRDLLAYLSEPTE